MYRLNPVPLLDRFKYPSNREANCAMTVLKQGPTPRHKMELVAEAQRRRSFAIISHPDAGKTTLTEKQVGVYSGKTKQIRPITVATYQVLTYRRSTSTDYEHMHLFADHNWGLLIYDEVHLLPAPVFGAV